ncbi:hypothetical protein C7S14_5198 [Burkholderia cepacia]|nr:hypothetical protein C7S14_5198 [Burkholderia cepacia]
MHRKAAPWSGFFVARRLACRRITMCGVPTKEKAAPKSGLCRMPDRLAPQTYAGWNTS